MQRIPLSMLRHLSSPAARIARPGVFANGSAHNFSTFRQSSNILNALKSEKAKWSSAATGLFARGATRSLYTEPIVQRTQFDWKRFGLTAAGVAGAVVAVNTVFNRETREGLSAGEQEYLHSTFKYTGGGLALTALAARAMFTRGLPLRLMAANPWVVLGVSLVGSIGSMMGVYYTAPENTVQKHLFWLAFNGFQAATLSPLFFVNPAILARAALYTVGTVGALSYIGATAKNETFLYMGGPLLAGVTVVALSSLAPMILPSMSMRALALTESVSLYGGLAVFGGFVLYDTQKILKHGRMVEAGVMKSDPLRESISLQLDMINIFIRLVQIFGMQGNKKK